MLSDKAYSDLKEKGRERLALTPFLAHIENPQVAFGVRQKRPEAVEAAVVATIELESYLNTANSAQRGPQLWHHYQSVRSPFRSL